MRKLAIFDIDGTLITHLPGGNDKCFIRTMKAEWGVDWLVDTTEFWATFTHATDSYIAGEMYRRQFGRDPEPAEVERVKAVLLADMRGEFTAGGSRYLATEGAEGLFKAVRGLGGWEIAIATGNWGATGRFKVENAGINTEGVAFSSADDAKVRKEIVGKAIAKARGSGVPYETVVYVGDAMWDADAAARLGIGFVGIGRGEDAARLAGAGARATMPDFADMPAFLRLLGEW